MPAGPALVYGKVVFPLSHYSNVLGRYDPTSKLAPEVDLVPLGLGRTASRRHAMIRYRDGAFVIQDLGSRLGTFVNGEPLVDDEERPLHNGDTVTIGDVTLSMNVDREWPPGLIAEWQSHTETVGSTVAPPEPSLLAELPAALRDGQLKMYFQPQVALATEQVCSVEALVRWVHPVHGVVSPAKFVPQAEESGFIKHLTTFALMEGARQSRIWREAGADISVSVNVTVKDLEDETFPDRAGEAIAAGHAQPGDLLLEVTESGVMSRPAAIPAAMAAMRDAGLHFGIDDFGTGESSLSYLSELPVDEVKLDMAFAQRLDSRNESIVRGAVTIGHDLGLVVVAEGIEDQRTANRLRELGCDKGQGYFYGRPAEPDALDLRM